MAVRTFVSIPVPVTEDILRASDDLKHIRGVRVTPAGQVHITLCFIGDIDEKTVPVVVECVSRSVSGVAPGTITLKGVGAFPDIRRPKVVWMGVETAVPLKSMTERLGKELQKEMVDFDGKPFKPHVTIGRIPEKADILLFIKDYEGKELGTFPCTSVKVMRSDLLPSGAKHTVLHSVELRNSP